MGNRQTTILFAFLEDFFTDAGVSAVEMMKRVPNRVVVVDKKGRVSRLLDDAGIQYSFLAMSTVVTPRLFILTAIIRLLRISLAQFLFIRQVEIPLSAAHFFDITTAMTWSGTCRMFRLPYIVSLNAMEAFSKYGSMVLNEARFLLAATPFVKETTPERLQGKMYVVPPLSQARVLTQNAATRERKKVAEALRIKAKEFILLATDVAPDAPEMAALTDALANETGKKVFAFSCVDGKEKGAVSFAFEDWIDSVSCCDFFVGLNDCTADAAAFFAATKAEVPVFVSNRGTYAGLVEENANGLFLVSQDIDQQAKQLAAFLDDAQNKEPSLKRAQRAWYADIRKKTMDFMDEMYDSV